MSVRRKVRDTFRSLSACQIMALVISKGSDLQINLKMVLCTTGDTKRSKILEYHFICLLPESEQLCDILLMRAITSVCIQQC